MLSRGAARLGFALAADDVARLLRYRDLLAEWGGRMNLTAIRDPQEVLTRHFLDSLALARHLPAAGHPSLASLVDVGSGAGFPGAVCALVRPGWRVSLVERTQKKAAFLLALRRELGLSFEVLGCDVKTLRQEFGAAVARAAFPPSVWLKEGARLVAPGGLLLCMLGAREEDLGAPAGFIAAIDERYDVGAGPRRILGFRRR